MSTVELEMPLLKDDGGKTGEVTHPSWLDQYQAGFRRQLDLADQAFRRDQENLSMRSRITDEATENYEQMLMLKQLCGSSTSETLMTALQDLHVALADPTQALKSTQASRCDRVRTIFKRTSLTKAACLDQKGASDALRIGTKRVLRQFWDLDRARHHPKALPITWVQTLHTGVRKRTRHETQKTSVGDNREIPSNTSTQAGKTVSEETLACDEPMAKRTQLGLASDTQGVETSDQKSDSSFQIAMRSGVPDDFQSEYDAWLKACLKAELTKLDQISHGEQRDEASGWQ